MNSQSLSDLAPPRTRRERRAVRVYLVVLRRPTLLSVSSRVYLGVHWPTEHCRVGRSGLGMLGCSPLADERSGDEAPTVER